VHGYRSAFSIAFRVAFCFQEKVLTPAEARAKAIEQKIASYFIF
jgi:hypothetical protein